MRPAILFIHGAGGGAYEADKQLVHALRSHLGSEYEIRYPHMPDEENAPFELWKQVIKDEIATLGEKVILVGHSVGASVIAKYLSQDEVPGSVSGVMLLSGPFWGGKGWHYDGYQELVVPESLATRIPAEVSVFLYHCIDDETVPFSHLNLYAELLPQATVRELQEGGHQFDKALSVVAEDVQSL